MSTTETAPPPPPAPAPAVKKPPAAKKRHPAFRYALALGVAAVIVGLAWQTRWMAEDGYIVLRVVEQIRAGNGPVFNIGERVEVVTSPLWLLVWLLGDLALPLRSEWVAIVLGLVGTGLGWYAATLASVRTTKRGSVVPAGVIVMSALPVTWHYATSGLETGLVFAWAGLLHLGLVVTGDGPGASKGVLRRAEVVLAWLPAGLGPLVRPDLAIVSIAALALLTVRTLRRSDSTRRLLVGWGAALALPITAQIARMAYFGTLAPNTALAKRAADGLPDRGLRYVTDFADTYFLLVAIAVVLAALVVAGWARRPAAESLVLAAAGAANLGYVVWIGGDYMFGRMVLPGLFLMLLPVWFVEAPASAILGVPRVAMARALAVGLLLWGVVAAGREYRPTGTQALRVFDEHAHMADQATRPHAILLEDQAGTPSAVLAQRALNRSRPGTLVMGLETKDPTVLPSRFADRRIVAVPFIGVTGAMLPLDVHVVDVLSLSEPIGSRLAHGGDRTGTAGHEQKMPDAWVQARFGPADPPDGPVRWARCILDRDAGQLLDSIGGPPTFPRLIGNIGAALPNTLVRFPAEPDASACRG